MHGQKSAGNAPPAPQPVLVVAMECDRMAAGSSRHTLGGVTQVLLGRGRDRQAERRSGPGGEELLVRVPDRWMSSQHARIESSFGRWLLYDAGSKNGTVINGTAVERAVLRDGDLIELGHTLFWFRERVPLAPGDLPDVHITLDALRERAPGLVTLAPVYARALGELERVSRSLLPIVLFGESGTGKELLARAIHALSARPGELVAVNCGAVPDTLVESELFGHRRGSFSGANEDRPGLVRSADRGTLFLDEIGDLPMASQAALLRVLQEREVMPVGASRPIEVDIRVVAATHRDLGAMVDRGEFRQDLYARLAGYTVLLPALRQRSEDIGLLVGALLARHAAGHGTALPAIDAAAARALFLHAWPRNIRELDSCLMAAAILAGADPIQLDHLPSEVRQGGTRPRASGERVLAGESGPSGERLAADQMAAEGSGDPAGNPGLDTDPGDNGSFIPGAPLSDEDRKIRDEVIASLRAHAGNISAVARAMGKDRKQIQRWVKRFDLDPQSYR
ncbi:MAG TPA: sigma 54-interacting transcriptional regulator [Kofleriaceae bacterium]|nr:sigma 54-interacting transcriptional regulator [Kofleriaceae bacterium]